MRCPTCRNDVNSPAKYRPFCSERCRMIDLGRWLDGGYTIPGEPVSADDLEALEEELAGQAADVDEIPARRRH